MKIGTTRGDIQRRLACITPHSPVPLELIATVDGDIRLEAALHAEFSELRLHNEWFRLEGALRTLVCRIIVEGEASVRELLAEIRVRNAKSEHGTMSMYNGQRCRCGECVTAARAYGRDQRRPGHTVKWRAGRPGRPPKHAT